MGEVGIELLRNSKKVVIFCKKKKKFYKKKKKNVFSLNYYSFSLNLNAENLRSL